MDSQGDSQYLSRQSKREGSQLLYPKAAFEEQQKQLGKIAEAEIDELKQSLRYVELQLAKCREERESFDNKILEAQLEVDRCQENLSKQIKVTQHQQKVIEELQKKLDAFNANQQDLVEKSRFKAGSYMNEINARDEELAKMRAQVMNSQDEMKLLTVSREQFRQQNEILKEQLRDREKESESLRIKINEQLKMIDNLCLASKQLNISGAVNVEGMDRAKDNIERVERIGKATNKSVFMSLGEKTPKLVSEEGSAYGHTSVPKRNLNVADSYKSQLDDTYLNDDTVPADIFSLIQEYREKIINSRGGPQASMIIDDFFSEAHSILKDSHMREIARIRNEHSVEIMRMRKNLFGKLDGGKETESKELRSKENFKASKSKDKFIENEVERQRRALVQENEILKQRLRAVETIAKSGNIEKQKFMEGASWIAKKAHILTEQHIQQLQLMIGEFERKSQDCVTDERILEVNGREILKVNDWVRRSIGLEIQDVGSKFEGLFENVNFHLKEATKEFQHSNK